MRINVRFEMELEGEPSHEDITKWILFELGEVCHSSSTIQEDLQAENTTWYPA